MSLSLPLHQQFKCIAVLEEHQGSVLALIVAQDFLFR